MICSVFFKVHREAGYDFGEDVCQVLATLGTMAHVPG